MARKACARRYAQAIFEMALEKKELEPWQSDLEKIVSTLADASFLAAWQSPKIHMGVKEKLLSEQLGRMNHLALNLVRLLISRGNLNMIFDIVDEYQRLLDSYHGIESAEVVTAVALDDKDMQKLAQTLSAMVDRKVVLKLGVDPGVIGGIVVRVGGKLLDGSTRSKLAALRRELVGVEKRR